MALTAKETARLAELKSQRTDLAKGAGQGARAERLRKRQFGESPIKPLPREAKLQQLRKRRAAIISQTAIQEPNPDELIGQLFGIGPLDKQPSQPTRRVTGDPGFIGHVALGELSRNISKRNNALRQLRKNFSDEQIQNAVNIAGLQRKARSTRASDLIPTAIGSVAGLGAGLLTGGPDPSDIATVPFVARTVANLIRGGATGLGTAGGEILRQKITGEEIDLRKAADAGTIDALLDFTGGTIVNKIGRSIAPFRQSIIPEAQAFAEDFARVGKKLGSDIPFRITPAQLTSSGAIDTFETIAETAPTSRGSIRNLKKIIQPEQFKKFTNFKLDEIAEGMKRLDATDLAPLIDDAIRGEKGTLTLAKIQNRRNFNALDEIIKNDARVNPVTIPQKIKSVILDADGKPVIRTITRNLTEEFPGAPIDLRPLKKQIVLDFEQSKKIGGRKFGASATSAMNDISASDDFVSYSLAKDLRTSLLGDLPALKFIRDKDVAKISSLAKSVNDLIVAPGSKFGISERAEAFRKIVNKFHSQNFGTGISGSKVGTFNRDAVKATLRAISKDQPEKLIPLFFKKDARATVELGIEVLGKKTFLRLRSTWLDNVARQSSGADGVIKGNVFLHNINRLGPETLDAIFPNPEHLKDIIRIGLGAEVLQKATGGAGNLASQQAQFGAILAIASGATKTPRSTITALGILEIPKMMAAVINSEKASRLLVQGLRLPPGSKTATSFFARAIRAGVQRDPEPILQEIKELQQRQQKIIAGREQLKQQGIKFKE